MHQDHLEKPPKVSIGMPVFNGEPFIREALDSLLAQTFTDFELIISDNGSTDGTEKICREYAASDPRIRYVRQPENRGAVFNFQYVLTEARGEYFMWAAHDDIWDSRWVEVLLPVSAENQCLAYGFVQTIDASSKKTYHVANGRKFDFTGRKLKRKIKYFVEPGCLGKANPIHGIFPVQKLRELDLSVLAVVPSGVDMLFLYDLLDHVEIRHGGSVYLYKRIPCESVEGEIIRVSDRDDLFYRLYAVLRHAFNFPMLGEYIKLSTLLESFFLVLFYPFNVSRAIAFAIINRLRHRLII
jgi:glycosyltransferase involved in cell wall biosynthesis